MNWRPKSLRGLLLLLLLPPLALSWALTALFTYKDSHHEIDELFDAQLVQSARLIASQVRPPRDEHRHEREGYEDYLKRHRNLAHKYEHQVAFQVFDPRGHLLAASSAWLPETPMAEPDGFSMAKLNDEDWQVFSFRDDEKDIRVIVGQRHRIRAELAGRVARNIFMPLLIFIPLSGLFVAFAVNRGVGPLSRVAGEVGRRTPDNLSPIATTRVPDEAKPLIDSLNSLLGRLQKAFDNERRFTADAAHELRTPLAGLKAQIQVARDEAPNSAVGQALSNALAAVDRMVHLTSQLLELARLDQLNEVANRTAIDLRSCASQVLAESANAAIAKNLDLSLSGEAAFISGQPFLIEILIRNLVDNAIRYTPEGGAVRVVVAQEPTGHVRLEVGDSGPGIPAVERTRIFERFVRGTGVRAPGSGLGLSIVKRIGDLHEAAIELQQATESGGLLVRVTFHGSGSRIFKAARVASS